VGTGGTRAPGTPTLSWRRRLVLARRAVLARRFTWPWVGGVVRSFAVSFAAFALTLQLLPGEQVPDNGAGALAGLVAAVFAVGAVLRPLLARLTVLTGVVGLLVVGLLAQSVVLGVALALVPAIEPLPLPEVVLLAWLVAVVAALLNWVADASTEEVFLGQVMGRSVRTACRADVRGPGLLVVQLDGVAEPLVRQAAASGAMPYLTRCIRSGSHRLRSWHTGLPSTTPAGQAVLLHGEARAVPAYRWYDKELGRVVQCGHPADAALVEDGFTTGRGLLADGGASVANLFSGDAPSAALTMARAKLPGTERGAAAYAVQRSGMVRSVVLLVGAVATEWYQARRQRRRDVRPRVPRGGAFLLLRGVTSVVLRDLAVAIVADQMARGVPVVYVDFVDYDEVAHHAGPTRPESLRTLEGLDRVLRFLGELAGEVGRDYELVVLSDHGQTQGSTFLQLTGRSLSDVVADLVDEEVDAAEATESLGAGNALQASSSPVRRLVGRLARRRDRADRRDAQSDDRRDDRGAAVRERSTAVQVAASGSTAHLYLPDHPGRVTRETLATVVPRLLPGLRELAHVGAVMTRTAAGEVVVEDARGWRVLGPDGTTGGEGFDPLVPYGARAAADLLELDAKQHVGDVVVLGRYDPVLGEVAAFEELVGSHGGLGGPQTEALLVHPADWDVPAAAPGEVLTGLDVHRLLVGRLESRGLRADGGAGDTTAPADRAIPTGSLAPAPALEETA